MAAVANNPKLSKKVGIPQSIGEKFMEADKGKKFRSGSSTKAGINKPKTHHGKIQMPNYSLQRYVGKKEGGIMKAKKMAMGGMGNAGGAMRGLDRAAAMSGRAMPTTGRPMAKGGATRMTAKGEHPVQKQSKRGAMMVKMAAGGLAAGHKSADGIAKKGKTKAKHVAMRMGGKTC